MGTLLLIIGIVWLLTLGWALQRRQRFAHDILAGGLLATLTILFFWRTIAGDVFQPADGGDLVSFLFPTYRFAASELLQGRLPLWNPHLYGGAPFISDIQAGFLYPPNLLLFLARPAFDYPALQWMVLGHLYWSALGMYVLLRTWRPAGILLSRGAAMLGAMAFQYSDPLLIHLGNLNLIAVLSWLPWVVAAYLLAWERSSWRWTALTALLFALSTYAGHAQSSYYIGMALGVYTLIRWLAAWLQTDRGNSRTRPELRPLVQLAVVAVLTCLLTAPLLLPALELTPWTDRAGLTYQEMAAFSLAPAQAAVGLVTPGFFGRGPALHWGLWDRVETPYAGVVTLLLAIGALLLAPSARRRELWAWVGTALFGLLIAFGIYAIFHGWLTRLLPGFDQFRAPARAIVLWTFSLSVLSAVGLDTVAARVSAESVEEGAVRAYRRFLRWGALALTGVCVPVMYGALLVTQQDPTLFLRASVALLALIFAALFWLIVWLLVWARAEGRIGARFLPAAALFLLFVDVTATGAYTDISSATPTRGFDHPEIVAYLRQQPGPFRIDTRTDIADLWQPDTAALYGLDDVRGIANPLTLRSWDRLWEATGGRHTALYDMLNTAYVIVRDGTPLPEGKFELALDAPGDLSVYRNLEALPRAWLVHEVHHVPIGAFDTTALETLFGELGLNPRTNAIVEAPAQHRFDLAAPVAVEEISVQRLSASTLDITVSASAPGLLIVSEVWYPGWRVSVNGEAGEMLRANGALRAVEVAAGRSTVRMHFAPAGWRWGVGLALLGLAAVVGLFVTDSSRRKAQNQRSA